MPEDSSHPITNPAKLWIKLVRDACKGFAYREVIGAAIVSFPGQKTAFENVPGSKPFEDKQLLNVLREDLERRILYFGCRAPEEMHRAGFLDSPHPIRSLDESASMPTDAERRFRVAALSVIRWYEIEKMGLCLRYASSSPAERWGIIERILERLSRVDAFGGAPTLKADELERDVLAAQRDAKPAQYNPRAGGSSESKQAAADAVQDRADAKTDLLALLMGGKADLRFFVKDGRLRIGKRQLRDKLAPDNEKRALTKHGEARGVNIGSIDGFDTEDSGATPVQTAITVDLLRQLRDVRDSLPPAQVAAIEHLYQAKDEGLTRAAVAAKYGVTEEAVRHAEGAVPDLIRGLRKKLA